MTKRVRLVLTLIGGLTVFGLASLKEAAAQFQACLPAPMFCKYPGNPVLTFNNLDLTGDKTILYEPGALQPYHLWFSGAKCPYPNAAGCPSSCTDPGTLDIYMAASSDGYNFNAEEGTVAIKVGSTLTVTNTTPAGIYDLTITGTSGSVARTADVSLVVGTPPATFTLAVSPSSQRVTAGVTARYPLTLTRGQWV